MKMITFYQVRAGFVLILLLLLPLKGQATCLVDCESSSSGDVSHFGNQYTQQASQLSNTNTDSNNRDHSHDMGNVKNSIVGDVYIRNGHEHMEIHDVHSQNAFIDASITSVVNLGDTRN